MLDAAIDGHAQAAAAVAAHYIFKKKMEHITMVQKMQATVVEQLGQRQASRELQPKACNGFGRMALS
jgi:hypothetical protein